LTWNHKTFFVVGGRRYLTWEMEMSAEIWKKYKKKYFSWPFLPLKCEGKCIVNVKKVLL
jgi:hypothetical protein